MDALEKYKQSWKNQSEEKNKFSKDEIYTIVQKKSSSIVKWIFVISILEFIFWSVVTFLIPDNAYEVYEDLNLTVFLYSSSAIHYCILLLFIYLFYRNYKQISVLSSTKKLMKSILKVRKTVKFYVIYNLLGFISGGLIINYFVFSDANNLQKILKNKKQPVNLDQAFIIMMVAQIITFAVFTLLLWLFYKLIYGFLLKKLNKNYTELINLDEQI